MQGIVDCRNDCCLIHQTLSYERQCPATHAYIHNAHSMFYVSEILTRPASHIFGSTVQAERCVLTFFHHQLPLATSYTPHSRPALSACPVFLFIDHHVHATRWLWVRCSSFCQAALALPSLIVRSWPPPSTRPQNFPHLRTSSHSIFPAYIFA